MDSIGAEVGQKMRSAIKAKLLELNCYVDDELPDYIMVMVANKRTKTQMKEDLQLFLTEKTSTFVDWLHIVLKKLKEVTVTNPDVYKKATKRKSDETVNVNVKKEKKDKKPDRKVKNEPDSTIAEQSTFKSLTDDLPINANKLAKQRKIVVMKENQANNHTEVMQDNFDIPLLSEVGMCNEEELEDIEKKIKNVKSRLGLLVESDDEGDCLNLKAEPDELFGDDKSNESKKLERKIQIIQDSNEKNKQQSIQSSKIPPTTTSQQSKRPERTKITFDLADHEQQQPQKNINKQRKPVMERLGKRSNSINSEEVEKTKRSRIILDDEENKIQSSSRNKKDLLDKPRESALSRLGVMSKVSVPQKTIEEPEETFKTREVPSVVKIKPRVIPRDAPQANKNLLLKAVAEAQRSIAQAPKVGSSIKPDALYTKKYKEKNDDKNSNNNNSGGNNSSSSRKLSINQKEKLKRMLVDSKEKNVSQSEDNNNSKISTNIPNIDENGENGKVKQQFIVTLDGIEKTKFKDWNDEENVTTMPTTILEKPSIKSRLEKKSPSPIIFDKVTTKVKTKLNIPDQLPVVHAPSSIKNKERCKYWPSCRQGDKCEFVHPSSNCDAFPHCKFGDKCLFLHPICKFGNSCTRRDCLYSHSQITKLGVVPIIKNSNVVVVPPISQICKYFPNCTNLNCIYYHPKLCKFGRNCKNQNECTFSHDFPINTPPNRTNLTWRPKY